jgi:hypothetical protein
MDPLGSGSGARNIVGLGMPAVADFAALALSTMRRTIAERTAVRKFLLVAATLNGIVPDDMISFVNAPVN